MKKLLLALLLLVLLLGVTYIKTVQGTRQNQLSFEKGKEDIIKQYTESKNTIDSLKLISGQRELEFADALIQKDISYQLIIDSLEALLENNSSKSSTDINNNDSQKLPTDSNSLIKIPELQMEKIINYYKSRYKNFPEDLSAYERKIALNEIRVETTQKFSLTLKELKLIRQKYNLNY